MSRHLSAGDWVEVRSREEILATLDSQGRLESLPFMPEMFEYCGRRLKVQKRAHKTCDPPDLRGRRIEGVVHLDDVRCDGRAHGGCQAKCLMFWKEAWLKKVDGALPSAATSESGCTEAVVRAATVRSNDASAADEEVRYVCQSTELRTASRPVRAWDLLQYVEDHLSGNVRLSEMITSFVTFLLGQIASARIGLGTPVRWLYDGVQRARNATPYPWRVGRVEKGGKTPSRRLQLKPGEWVRVKPYDQILETLDQDNHNRGLAFDAEMVPYCGRTFQVLDRVERIIDERTGRMLRLTNDCILLDQVVCRACYAKHRRFCPRAIYPFWREVWLDRLG